MGPCGGLERKGVDSSSRLSQEGVCKRGVGGGGGAGTLPQSQLQLCLPKGLLAAESPLQHHWPWHRLFLMTGRISPSLLRQSLHLALGHHIAVLCLSFPQLAILEPAWLPAPKTGCHCGIWGQSPSGSMGCIGAYEMAWDELGGETGWNWKKQRVPPGCRVGSVSLQPVLFPALVLGSILAVGREARDSPYAGAGQMTPPPHLSWLPGVAWLSPQQLVRW